LFLNWLQCGHTMSSALTVGSRNSLRSFAKSARSSHGLLLSQRAFHPAHLTKCGFSAFVQPLSFDVLKDLNRVLQFHAASDETQGAVPFGKLERIVDAAATHGLTKEGTMALDVALVQRNAHFSERFYAAAASLRFKQGGPDAVHGLMGGLHQRMGPMDRPFLDRVLVHCIELGAAAPALCVFSAARSPGAVPSVDVMRALASAAALAPVHSTQELPVLLDCMREHGLAPPVEVFNARLRSEELTPDFQTASSVLGDMSRGGTRGDADTIAAVVQLGKRVVRAEVNRGLDPAAPSGGIACLLPLVSTLTGNGVPLSAQTAVQLTQLLREHGQLHAATQFGEAALASGALDGGVVAALVLAYSAAGRSADIAQLWSRVRPSAHILEGQPAEVHLEILRAASAVGDHASVLQLHSTLMAARNGGKSVPDEVFQLVLLACSNLRDGAHLQRTLYTALSEGSQLTDSVARGILQHACELSPTRAMRCFNLLQRQRPDNWGDAAVMVLSLAKPKSMQQAWQVAQGVCLKPHPKGFELSGLAVESLSAALLQEASRGEAMPGAGALRLASVTTSLQQALSSKQAAVRHSGGATRNTEDAPQNIQNQLASALQAQVQLQVAKQLQPAPERSPPAHASPGHALSANQPRPQRSPAQAAATGSRQQQSTSELGADTPRVVFSTKPLTPKGAPPRGPKLGGTRTAPKKKPAAGQK